MKEKFKLKYGDQLSKVFIAIFFVAVFNSLLFYITFNIKDSNREIQQPSVLVQLILSAFMTVIFSCMYFLESLYTLDKWFYFSLAGLNAVNCVLLGFFYGFNKKNNNNDKDNKKKTGLFFPIYGLNLVIFALSIFLCTKMFKSFIQC